MITQDSIHHLLCLLTLCIVSCLCRQKQTYGEVTANDRSVHETIFAELVSHMDDLRVRTKVQFSNFSNFTDLTESTPQN